MYCVTFFEAVRSYHLKKMQKQIWQEGELWQKVMNNCKYITNSKVQSNLYKTTLGTTESGCLGQLVVLQNTFIKQP